MAIPPAGVKGLDAVMTSANEMERRKSRPGQTLLNGVHVLSVSSLSAFIIDGS